MSFCELATDLDRITLADEDIATCWHLERDTLETEILDCDHIICEFGHET